MTQARPNFNLSQSVLQILLAQASPPRAAAHQLPASGATQPKRARIRGPHRAPRSPNGHAFAARIGRHAAQTGTHSRPASGATQPKRARIRDSSPPGFNAGEHALPGSGAILRRQASNAGEQALPGSGAILRRQASNAGEHALPGSGAILRRQASNAGEHALPGSGAILRRQASNAGEHALPGSGEILRSLTRALTRCLDRAPHRSQAQIGRRTARKSRFPRRPGGCIV